MYIWHDISASNMCKISKIFSCLSKFFLKQLYEIGPWSSSGEFWTLLLDAAYKYLTQCSSSYLKTVDTIGNCQRPVFSLGVSQHMHKITNLWKFELDWSSELRDMMKRKKTPLSHEVVCFQMLDFETSNSKSEVSKSNSWKITSFSKSTSLQREMFLTMFYTINLSPLFVTKWGFIYADNYFE